MKKTRLGMIGIVAVLIIIVAAVAGSANYIIDYQWFKEMGYIEVFFKKIVTQLKFFIPAFIIFFLVFFVYINSIDGKKDKTKAKVRAAISSLMALFLSFNFVNTIWYDFLVFMNKTEFGLSDPIFARDIGFYVFSLPFLNKIYGVAMTIVVAFAAITILYGFINMAKDDSSGPIEVDENYMPKNLGGDLKSVAILMTKQLANVGAIFFLLLGASFVLRSFTMLYSATGVSFGAGYTDVKVLIPFNFAYAAACVVTAITLLIGVRNKNKKVLLAGPTLLAICLIGSGVVAAFTQSVLVKPNEISKESQYIQNTIDYTKYAYGLDQMAVQDFAVDQKLTRADIDNNEETISNIPVNDYKPALKIYNQIQGLKTYYSFNDMDIDRYMIDGQYRQVFISARELVSDNIAGQDRSSWINRYLKYTHGYGVAMSPVNEVTSSGQPKLLIKDIPVTSTAGIDVTVPQIYYGELANDFAIVNTKEKEFDYQTSSEIVESTYAGTGGIKLSLFNRALFALTEGNMNFLLSQDLTSESKILLNRNVSKRIEKIAPFLEYDGDPYLVISEGKLYWIIDAFTVSNKYPYAEPFASGGANYIRNSVKVVVDAYNGNTDFYIADENDPLIMTYSKIYKTLFKPLAKMPEDLRSHIRYSQTMFNIQADMYRKYHIKDARELYNKSDMWDIGQQIYGTTSSETVQVESAYMIMNLPDTADEEFVLMIPYTPQGKANMIAWMAVRNDGKEYGKLILYEFPSGKAVEGPMQFEGIINQDVKISNELNLLNAGGNSQVVRGNTLIIPVEQSLLYVEPIYIQADNETSLPELKKVIVYYKNKVIMEESLEKALTKMFPTEGEPDIPTVPVIPPADGVVPPPADGVTPPTDTAGETIESLIADANTIYEQSQEALKNGDWTTYGEKLNQVEEILKKLAILTGQ